MSADWTTCRVVRDADGYLWGPARGGWIHLDRLSVATHTADEVDAKFGPLTPVLDADGLPVGPRRLRRPAPPARPRRPAHRRTRRDGRPRTSGGIVSTIGDLTAAHIGAATLGSAEPNRDAWRGYCTRGPCAAEDGHAGTCAEASGWIVADI